MISIVVERDFDRPHSVEDMLEVARQLRWCTDRHRVAASRWRYLALDGTRCACVYTAPDLEAIRQVLRRSPSGPPKRLWAAATYSAEGADDEPLTPGFTLAVVERSLATPVRFDQLPKLGAHSSACFSLHRVRFLRSHLAADGRRMLCVFEAPDLESVRLGNRRAGLPADAIWAATLIPPLSQSTPHAATASLQTAV